MERPNTQNEDKARTEKTSEEEATATQPIASPGTDPTNPHNQEPAGDWVANERASERRNSEPG